MSKIRETGIPYIGVGEGGGDRPESPLSKVTAGIKAYLEGKGLVPEPGAPAKPGTHTKGGRKI